MFQLNLQVNCKEGMRLTKDSNGYAFIETIFFNGKRKKPHQIKGARYAEFNYSFVVLLIVHFTIASY